MRKLAGYFVIVFGLIILGLTVKPIKSLLNIFVPFDFNSISNFYIIGFGAIVLVVGIFLLKGTSGSAGKQQKEVPIYKGKNVVGFRVIGK